MPISLNRSQIGKYETVLKILSAVVVLTVAVLMVASVLSMLLNPISAEQTGGTGYTIDGENMNFNGAITFTSKSFAEINDLSLTVLIGPSGKTIKVIDVKDVDIKSGRTEISLNGKIPAREFFPMLDSMSDSAVGRIPMSVNLSGKFIFGLVGMNAKVDTFMDAGNGTSNMHVDIAHSELEDTATLSGMGDMVPDGVSRFVAKAGNTTVTADITSANGVMTVKVSATEGGAAVATKEAADRMLAAYKAGTLIITDGDGHPLQVGKDEIDISIFLVYGITGGV